MGQVRYVLLIWVEALLYKGQRALPPTEYQQGLMWQPLSWDKNSARSFVRFCIRKSLWREVIFNALL
jgi:hypothetical protein